MKRTRFVRRFFTILALLIVPVKISAQIEAGIDYSSRYIWRGFDLNPYREPVLQPYADYIFGSSGLRLSLWGSISFANKEANEIDLTLSYDIPLHQALFLQAGLVHYGWYSSPNFRFKDDTSHEIYLSAGLPQIFCSPILTLFYDFTNGDGLYLLLETQQGLKISNNFASCFSASLGYNGGQWLAEGVDPGFSDLNLGLSLPVTLGLIEISPFTRYTFVLLDAIGHDNHWLYGVSVQIELNLKQEKELP